jgi:hypothetical protein
MQKTFHKVLNEVVAPPSSVVPGISPELDAIVARALEKDRTKRYQTALEMRDDLERYIASSAPPVRQEDVGQLVSGLYREERDAVGKRIGKIMTEGEDEEISVTVLPMLVERTTLHTDSSQSPVGFVASAGPLLAWSKRMRLALGALVAIGALGTVTAFRLVASRPSLQQPAPAAASRGNDQPAEPTQTAAPLAQPPPPPAAVAPPEAPENHPAPKALRKTVASSANAAPATPGVVSAAPAPPSPATPSLATAAASPPEAQTRAAPPPTPPANPVGKRKYRTEL